VAGLGAQELAPAGVGVPRRRRRIPRRRSRSSDATASAAYPTSTGRLRDLRRVTGTHGPAIRTTRTWADRAV